MKKFNKKGSMIIVYMILGLALIVLTIPVVKYIKDSSDSNFFKENGINPADDFVPYDIKNHYSPEEKTVDNSIRALQCAINNVAEDKIDSCATNANVANTKNYVCCKRERRPRLISDPDTIQWYEAECPKNAAQTPKGPNDLPYAYGYYEVQPTNGKCGDKQSPMICTGSTFGTSCVSCKNVIINAKQKTECTLYSFELPQPDVKPSWIAGYGDPKYLLYYEAFPTGEDTYWKVDMYSFQPTWLIAGAAVTLVVPINPKVKEILSLNKGGSFFNVFNSAAKQDSILYKLITSERTKSFGTFLKTLGKGSNKAEEALAFEKSILNSGISQYLKETDADAARRITDAFIKNTDDTGNIIKNELTLKYEIGEILNSNTGWKKGWGEMEPEAQKIIDFFKKDVAKSAANIQKAKEFRRTMDAVNDIVEKDKAKTFLKESGEGIDFLTQEIKNGKLSKDQIIKELVTREGSIDPADLPVYNAILQRLVISSGSEASTFSKKLGALYTAVGRKADFLVNDPTMRLSTLYGVGMFANQADKNKEKVLSKGKDTMTLTMPSLLSSSNTYDFPSVSDKTLVLIRNNADKSRFHLVSPCKVDLTLKKTNMYINLNDIKKFDLYDFGSGYVTVEKGSIKYNPQKPITFTDSEIKEYETQYAEIKKLYDEANKDTSEFMGYYAIGAGNFDSKKNYVCNLGYATEQKYYTLINKILKLPTKFYLGIESNQIQDKSISKLYLLSTKNFIDILVQSKKENCASLVTDKILKDQTYFSPVVLNKDSNTFNLEIEKAIWDYNRKQYCLSLFDIVQKDPCLLNINNCIQIGLDIIKGKDVTDTITNALFTTCDQNYINVPWYMTKQKSLFLSDKEIPSLISKPDFSAQYLKMFYDYNNLITNVKILDYDSLYRLKDFFEFKFTIISAKQDYQSSIIGFTIKDYENWITVTKEIQERFPSSVDASKAKKDVSNEPVFSDTYLTNKKMVSEAIIFSPTKQTYVNSANYCFYDTTDATAIAKKVVFAAGVVGSDIAGCAAAAACTSIGVGLAGSGVCYKGAVIAFDTTMAYLEHTLDVKDKWPGS